VVLRRLSPARGFAVTDALVRILLPIHRRGRRFARLLNRLSPVYSYYHVHPELSEELQREWAFMDTHDALTDWYKHFRSRDQVQGLLERLGFEEIWCTSGGNGVEARARRPLGRARPYR
jgi:hypothetical protein